MKEITELELIELVNRKSDINFLSAAITPWHALGTSATILQLSKQGIKLKGYIMVVAHSVSGTGIDESSFCIKETPEIEIVRITKSFTAEGFFSKIVNKIRIYSYYTGLCRQNKDIGQAKLYWVVPLKPSFDLIPHIAPWHKNRRLSVILIDEGIAGTYLTSTGRWCALSFQEGGWKAGIRALWALYIRDSFFMHRLQKQGFIEYRQLLSREAKSLMPNKPVIEAYREILRQKKSDKEFTYYSNAVIINSDMLKQTGILKNDIDLEIMEVICSAMHKKGIPVILKPHPRETDIERYEGLTCQIERTAGIAQESIWGTLKEMPYCVIGFASTTLVTAKLLFDIKAISLNDMIKDEFAGDKGVFEKFHHTFRDLIHFPKNADELLTIMSEFDKG